MAKKEEKGKTTHDNIFNVPNIFRSLMYEENALSKTIILSVTLLFSVLLVSIGLYLGYFFEFVKNVMDRRRKKVLPEWDFNNWNYIWKLYLRGWKLFLILLPFILINIL